MCENMRSVIMVDATIAGGAEATANWMETSPLKAMCVISISYHKPHSVRIISWQQEMIDRQLVYIRLKCISFRQNK